MEARLALAEAQVRRGRGTGHACMHACVCGCDVELRLCLIAACIPICIVLTDSVHTQAMDKAVAMVVLMQPLAALLNEVAAIKVSRQLPPPLEMPI